MRFIAANPWFNIVWFQLCWLVAVLGRTDGLLLLALLLIVHFLLVPDRKIELLTTLSCALIGILIDTLLTFFAVFEFSPAPQAPLPLWLAGLWLAFSATLRHSLSFLQSRFKLAAILAAVGGPMSYLAGMKLEAVSFSYDLYLTLALLALVWAVLMPILLQVNRRVAQEGQA